VSAEDGDLAIGRLHGHAEVGGEAGIANERVVGWFQDRMEFGPPKSEAGKRTVALPAAALLERLRADGRVRILADVVLNQVLVRFEIEGQDPDELTRSVIRRVQQEGTCWLGGTTWHGMAAMRISVSNWSTTEADVDASADAILRCLRESDE